MDFNINKKCNQWQITRQNFISLLEASSFLSILRPKWKITTMLTSNTIYLGLHFIEMESGRIHSRCQASHTPCENIIPWTTQCTGLVIFVRFIHSVSTCSCSFSLLCRISLCIHIKIQPFFFFLMDIWLVPVWNFCKQLYFKHSSTYLLVNTCTLSYCMYL